MDDLYKAVLQLIAKSDVRVSEHGLAELAADSISVREAVASAPSGQVIEAYPDYPKGPCVLVLQSISDGRGVHILGHTERPDAPGRTNNRLRSRSQEVGIRFEAEASMNRMRTKLVQEGNYLAEVDVELLEEQQGWSPYISLEDAYRLDDVRDALRRGDLETASQHARIFTLTPVGQ